MARLVAPKDQITASIDACAEKITLNGGKVIQPKQAIPGVGHVLIFQDTEGNMFGILQTDIDAK